MDNPGAESEDRLTLGGFICLKDATRLDFCWRESVKALLPVCETVALSVASGDLATEVEVRGWMATEPKLSLNIYPWVEPVGNAWWYNQWLQYARAHTAADLVFQMDADEVLHEDSYQEVIDFKQRPGRFSVLMDRLNFWRDAKHLIPPGVCLSHRVVRIAPQDMYLASDGADPLGWEAPQLAVDSKCQIFHYGFIRKPAAFFEKERKLQGWYFNSYDPRLEAAESAGTDWSSVPNVTGWENSLVNYDGSHPAIMREWLKERGY